MHILSPILILPLYCVNDISLLKNSRKLESNNLVLRKGNGAKVIAHAIRIYSLSLSSGMTFELKECLYVCRLSRDIILVSYLIDDDDFEFIMKSNSCVIILNDMVYGWPY